MLRAIIFMDHLNFDIAYRDYYLKQGRAISPRLDYNELPKCMASSVPDATLIKTICCIPKPDTFLMTDPKLAKEYQWASNLKNNTCFDVVEGEYLAGPVKQYSDMDITDHETYFKVEKGTDINMAVEALTKAYNNAFDIGVFISGDSDYLPIYKTLKTMGKMVVVGAVSGQNIGRVKPYIDRWFWMDDAFFGNCLRK